MISASDILHLPYTRDLTEGGIVYALRSMPYSFHRVGGSSYDRLRRRVTEAAAELAFRRYLSEQAVPFEVKASLPFANAARYDVSLGGRRCEVKAFLIHQRDQILQIQRHPELLLKATALVVSDQHAAEGQSPRDLYLFAFLMAESKGMEASETHYLIHAMPEAWNRPSRWHPIGKLILKSTSEETQRIEIGGQDEGRVMRTLEVELPPQTRLEIQNPFFSISYLHTKGSSPARVGIHNQARKETHLVEASDWVNIWIYGQKVLLAGYITREEFSRRASFIPQGSRVFQYTQTQVKNLAVPVADLRPISELFERVNRSQA